MPGTIADQVPELAVAEVRNGKVSFADLLDSGELLTGTPTVVEVTTSDLTISNVGLNSSAVTMFGVSVDINKVVTFKVLGQLTNVVYTLLITTATNATIAQTFKRQVKFRVT